MSFAFLVAFSTNYLISAAGAAFKCHLDYGALKLHCNLQKKLMSQLTEHQEKIWWLGSSALPVSRLSMLKKAADVVEQALT